MKFMTYADLKKKSFRSWSTTTDKQRNKAKMQVVEAGQILHKSLGPRMSEVGQRAIYYNWDSHTPYATYQIDGTKYSNEEIDALAEKIPDQSEGFEVFYMIFDNPCGFAGSGKAQSKLCKNMKRN